MTDPLPSVFLNGTVGSGKTTTAFQLGALLRGRGIPHAVIDLDALRTGWPAPAADPFNHELELANLQAVAANFAAAGARVFILAGVPEAMAWHLHRAPELTEILDRAGDHDGVVDTTGSTPEEAAGRILRQLESVSLSG